MNAPVPGFVHIGAALRSALGALSVACPRCSAEPGERCSTIHGHPTTSHTDRHNAFMAVRDGSR